MKKLINTICIMLIMIGCTHLDNVDDGKKRKEALCKDTGVDTNQEEKIELFFDEFIDLLRKYNEAGTEKLNLIKSDLETLCDRYEKYGVDPLGKKYTWGDDTYTPLQFAARQGNQTVIEVLCLEGYRARADIHAKTDVCGSTALQLAIEGGHSHIAKHLLSLDQALASAQDKEGQSALHYATYGKHVSLANYLVNDAKADLNVLDNNGLSVLHVAVYVQSVELVDLFLQNMTQETADARDSKGNKAIDYVNEQTAPDIQKCFESYQTASKEISVDEKEQDSMGQKRARSGRRQAYPRRKKSAKSTVNNFANRVC